MHGFDPDRLLAAQGGLCFWCELPLGRGATIDHLIPKAYGGIDAIENCVMAHRRCNQLKGDRLPSAAEVARLTTQRRRSRLPVWPPLLVLVETDPLADPDAAWMAVAVAIRDLGR